MINFRTTVPITSPPTARLTLTNSPTADKTSSADQMRDPPTSAFDDGKCIDRRKLASTDSPPGKQKFNLNLDTNPVRITIDPKIV